MTILYMAGTIDSVKEDSFMYGPHPRKEYIISLMEEGDVLVGKRIKRKDIQIVSKEQMIGGKLVELKE